MWIFIEEIFCLNIPELPKLPEAKGIDLSYRLTLMKLAAHYADKKIPFWKRRSKAIADKVILDTYMALRAV